MAKFIYRLQPLLSLKEQIEEQKEIEYGQALRRLEEERRKKLALLAKREEQISQFRKSVQASIIPADTQRFNNTIEKLKQRIREQEKRIEAAEIYAEKKRVELVEAMQQRKMLDTIKDNRFEDYKLNEKLAEQRGVDERVSYQYS